MKIIIGTLLGLVLVNRFPACAQHIHLKSAAKQGKTETIAVGDIAYIILEDFTTEERRGRNKRRLVYGRVLQIKDEYIVIKQRRSNGAKVEIDQILKIKKEYPASRYTSLAFLGAGSLVYLHSIEELYPPPASIALLVASVSHRLIWDNLINPMKIVSPDLFRKRNSWEFEVVN